jgi:hypothetical protein
MSIPTIESIRAQMHSQNASIEPVSTEPVVESPTNVTVAEVENNDEGQANISNDVTNDTEHDPYKGVKKKIDKMTARLSQRDAEIERLSAELSALKQPQKPIDLDELTVDERISHLARQEAMKILEAQRNEHIQAEIANKGISEWEEKVAKVTEKYPDYSDVLADARIPLPNMVLSAIENSDHGPELAYKLATQPELATRLGKVDPITAAKMLMKLETEIENSNLQTKTQAPKTVKSTPAPGKPGVPTSNKRTEMTMDQIMALKIKQRAKR